MSDRRPEIDAYLRQNADRYTSDALRAALVDAGHDPAAVDAALAEWRTRRTTATDERDRFWRFTWLFHGLALFVVVVLVAVASGDYIMRGVWPIVAAILAIVLLLGVALSGLIGGRLLLPRTGLAWALVVPVASALLIGGTCYAMTGGFGVGAPPAPNGNASLHLEQPELIDASGPAHCQAPESVEGYSIYADEMETERGPLTVSLDAHGGAPDLYLAFASGRNGRPPQFSVNPGSVVTIAPNSDRLHGSVEFQGLGGVGEDGLPAAETASGRFAWDCTE